MDRNAVTGVSASASRWIIAIVAVVGLAVGAALFFPGTNDDNAGRHSAYTRQELETTWSGSERAPLRVPLQLPEGAEESPEVGFSLDTVVTDKVRHAASRQWVSYYNSDVLGGTWTSFRVFQRPTRETSSSPCGPIEDQFFVERRVADANVTICSSALSEGSTAREYWETVTFTSDLEQVDWLSG